MQKILKFLEELSCNNNREWFLEHKAQYNEVQEQVNSLTTCLIEGLSRVDDSIGGLQVKDCTYRIYRDVRFSPNKMPYKNHIGIYVCPSGKKSGYAGYYLHLEPFAATSASKEKADGDVLWHGPLLAAGLHCPEPKVIASIRDEIFSHADSYVSAIEGAEGFDVDNSTQLKRLPRDFAKIENIDPRIEGYLRLRDYDLIKPLEKSVMRLSQDRFVDSVVAEFAKTTEFNRLLNRSVRFTRER